MNLIRWSLALVIMLPFVYRSIQSEYRMIFRHWRIISILGVLGIASFQVFLYLALQTTAVVNALLLLSLCPVLIFTGNVIFYRELPPAKACIGITVSLLGVFTVISHGAIDVLKDFAFGIGDFWMLLASSTWAAYSIALRSKPKAISQLHMLFSSAVVGVSALAVAALVVTSTSIIDNWDLPTYLSLAYLAFVPSVLAFICWNRGVELLGANQAGAFLHLIPLFGAFLSLILLGEKLALYHLAGALLIFAGIALTSHITFNNNS
ncbi:MAG: drug/metabolite transporter (DMT)-like permease [Pseudohongiellaceae bacterium]|jgi:drug/metabolite transporter (DMT)-like permease